MKLRCHLEAADYVRAQYLHQRPRPALKWAGIFLIGLMLLVTIQGILIQANGRIGASPFIMIAVGGYLAFVYIVWLPYQTRTLYKQQKMLQEPYDLEITQEDFIATNSHGTARIKWADFHKYKVGSDLILVYQSDALFHIFPRRWFNEGEFDALLEILKSALGKPKP